MEIIASRIFKYMFLLANAYQVSFISGYQASDATGHIVNLMYVPESARVPSPFLTLVNGNAFDRILWGYLHKVLLKFEFHGNILAAILVLLNRGCHRAFP